MCFRIFCFPVSEDINKMEKSAERVYGILSSKYNDEFKTNEKFSTSVSLDRGIPFH